MKTSLVRFLVVSIAGVASASSGHSQWMSLADSTATPVVVESAAITAEITGQFAVTTYDLTFRNPNRRPLEGTFEFPLLEGQSVVRFALDIGGRLREAMPVAKERGRVVFEEIQRRRVDPGLLEQTAGNNYRARVFPLPAQGTRRIVIAYQESLRRDDRDMATFRLALAFPERLKRFSMDVSYQGGGHTAPEVRSTLPFQWPAWSETRVLALAQEDVQPSGTFELTLPPADGPMQVTQHFNEREYFHAEVPLPPMSPKVRAAPKVVGLLWDASGSAHDSDQSRLFAFLDHWFTAVPDVEVKLVLLRDTATPAGTFRVKDGGWFGLRRALRSVDYDGATSLDGVVEDGTVDEWLLVSDGLINFGRTATSGRLPVSAPVHAIVTRAEADTSRLRGLAQRHGGEYANLIETDPVAVARRVRHHSVRVLGIERNPAEVAEIFPERGMVLDGPRLSMTGVLCAMESTVRIRVGWDEADARVVEIPLRRGVGAGQLAARAWAGAKIAALAVDLEANREDIRRTSEEFGVVAPDTSLIVLEALDDYVSYGIAPPAELRAPWEAMRAQRGNIRQKNRAVHLDYVVRAFAERQRWWEHPFPSRYEARIALPDRPPAATDFRSEAAQREDARFDPNRDTWFEPAGDGSDDEIIVLSPFEVSTSRDGSYTATSTLAGSRVRTGGGGLRGGRRARESNAEAAPNVEAGDVEDSLQAWSPNAGYIERLRRVAPPERYGIYFEERADHQRAAGFYLDVAGFFFETGDSALAIRILSNLAELGLEDAALLRVLGHRLMQASRSDLALPIFERVLRIRGEDPQSHRDLALACAAEHQYQRAIDLLWKVVETPWDNRFPDVELVALSELNAIVATCGEALDLSQVDERLRRNLAVDVRIVLTWDADNCDIDLWVDDPRGERVSYSHPISAQGGRISHDLTGGFGPEEFVLRCPEPGRYTVRLNYFGDERNGGLGPVTAQVKIVRGFGTSEQVEQIHTVRLVSSKETIKVAAFAVEPTVDIVASDDKARRPARRGR